MSMSEEEEITQRDSQTLDMGILIETIQQYEYLYDLRHKDYKNAKKKELAWKEISNVLHASVDACMKAWKNIRDRYVKERNKLRSGDEAPEIVWPYFDQMQFYNQYTKTRQTYSSTAEVQKKMKMSQSAETSRPSTSCSENLPMDNILSPISLSEQPIEELSTTPSCSSKGKRKTSEENCLLEVMKTAKQISLAIQNPAAKNTNNSFSEYVYFRLQAMSEEEARVKRRQINLILESDE